MNDSNLGVQNVLPGMSVEGLLETLLVEGVTYETNASGQDEQAVQITDVYDFIYLLLFEHITARQEIQKQSSDATVHVQDQIGGLAESVVLDRHRIVQVLDMREVGASVLLQ
ncbi:hypothetical protein Mapa_008278 [Marchantia paleacea]|nr:hypothetical protein Mapa_008278 [Marchantia paleacea]